MSASRAPSLPAVAPRCLWFERMCSLTSWLCWMLGVAHRGVALELQQEARAGSLSLDGNVCHVVRDAAVPDPALMAAQREGVALRSPMYCDTRRDLNNKPGYDCFGQPLMSAAGDKSTENIMCPNCGQKTGAARFAPHLQRCMGGGRNATTTRRSTTPVCNIPPSHWRCGFSSREPSRGNCSDRTVVCAERQWWPQFR